MLAGSPLYLASGCRPFERNPLLANLPHSKTAEVSITKYLVHLEQKNQYSFTISKNKKCDK